MWAGEQAHQDAIKLSKHKCQARLVGSLSKGLMLHVDAAKVEDIAADKARQAAAAILDVELGAIFLQAVPPACGTLPFPLGTLL